VYTSAISWDGCFLATSSADKTIRVYDIRTKEVRFRFTYEEASTLGFSPDGRLLAAGNKAGNLTVFRLADGTTAVLHHGGSVNQVLFSPDGRYMATASDDRIARVFETSGWRLRLQMRHQSPVPSVAFSWDRRYVISAGQDDAVQVFDVTTGTEVERLDIPGGITAVAVSQDNRIIVLSAKVISGHWFRPDDLIREACSRVTRNLSPEEWKQFMGAEPYRETCSR
jgi:WD40 repeat protein